MLTIEEIKKELDAGENVELECIDEDGFKGAYRRNNEILNAGNIVISSAKVGKNGFVLTDGNNSLIYEEELKYFRIKRPTPTFDDLIDVAVKAAIDGVLAIKQLDEECLSVVSRDGKKTFERWRSESSYKDTCKFIDFINSLYTETFVIEDVSSFLKITEGIQSLVLANGCDITNRVYFDDCNLRFKDGWGDSITLTFDILKGAIVTQKRGEA